MRKVLFTELNDTERWYALGAMTTLMGMFSYRRVEQMFAVLRRGDSLLQSDSTLTRSERLWAAATVLAFNMELGEERGETLIQYLGQKEGVVTILLWNYERHMPLRAFLTPLTAHQEAIVH